MSIIILPAGLYPRMLLPQLVTNQRAHASPFGGSEQVVDMLNDRWTFSLEFTPRKLRLAAPLEAFIASLRGQTNTVGLWHFARPLPAGTMRGAPVLAASAAQGAASISIQTAAGATLLAGDLVGVAGLLLMVQSNALANGAGVMVVPIVNRLRLALSSGAAVAWDKPLVQCTMLATSGQQYTPGVAQAVQFDFVERIS